MIDSNSRSAQQASNIPSTIHPVCHSPSVRRRLFLTRDCGTNRLNFLFEKIFSRALQVLEKGHVKCYIGERSQRKVFQVRDGLLHAWRTKRLLKGSLKHPKACASGMV